MAGNLTNDDLDRVAGKFDVLRRRAPGKYGYTRQRAVEAIDQRVSEYEADMREKAAPPPGKGSKPWGSESPLERVDPAANVQHLIQSLNPTKEPNT